MKREQRGFNPIKKGEGFEIKGKSLEEEREEEIKEGKELESQLKFKEFYEKLAGGDKVVSLEFERLGDHPKFREKIEKIIKSRDYFNIKYEDGSTLDYYSGFNRDRIGSSYPASLTFCNKEEAKKVEELKQEIQKMEKIREENKSSQREGDVFGQASDGMWELQEERLKIGKHYNGEEMRSFEFPKAGVEVAYGATVGGRSIELSGDKASLDFSEGGSGQFAREILGFGWQGENKEEEIKRAEELGISKTLLKFKTTQG